MRAPQKPSIALEALRVAVLAAVLAVVLALRSKGSDQERPFEDVVKEVSKQSPLVGRAHARVPHSQGEALASSGIEEEEEEEELMWQLGQGSKGMHEEALEIGQMLSNSSRPQGFLARERLKLKGGHDSAASELRQRLSSPGIQEEEELMWKLEQNSQVIETLLSRSSEIEMRVAVTQGAASTTTIGVIAGALLLGLCCVVPCCLVSDISDEDDVPAPGVDVQRMIEQTVEVRLPRLGKDGTFAAPTGASEKNVFKTSPPKVPPPQWRVQFTAMRQTAKDSLDSFQFDPIQDAISLARKYWPDLILQGTYIGVALVLAGSAGGIASKLDNAPTSLISSSSSVVGDLEGAQSQALQWWVFGMGVFSGLALVIKNVHALSSPLFQAVDQMQASIDAAVDTIKADVPKQVEGMLSKNLPKAASTIATPMVVKTLRAAISNAQKQLDARNFLPWPVSSRCCFMTTFGPPLVIVVLAMGAVQFFTSSLSTGIRHTVHIPASLVLSYAMDITSLSSTSGSALKSLLTNVILNLLWGFLASWPVIRLVANTSISAVQDRTNSFLLGVIVDHIPGGVGSLQKTVDAASELSGGDIAGAAGALGCGSKNPCKTIFTSCSTGAKSCRRGDAGGTSSEGEP